jgi:hypothetical protein
MLNMVKGYQRIDRNDYSVTVALVAVVLDNLVG